MQRFRVVQDEGSFYGAKNLGYLCEYNMNRQLYRAMTQKAGTEVQGDYVQDY